MESRPTKGAAKELVRWIRSPETLWALEKGAQRTEAGTRLSEGAPSPECGVEHGASLAWAHQLGEEREQGLDIDILEMMAESGWRASLQ